MSIIDNLLVLLDDEKNRTIDEILDVFSNNTKQVISASLGRLVSRKLVKNNNDKYLITKHGRDLVTNNLQSLNKLEKNIITNVRFIMFNIPEKERVNRDMFRNYLTKKSYGRLHNTVWINFHKDNLLEKTIKELGITKNVLILNIKPSNEDLVKIFKNTIFNYKLINKNYKLFIKQAEDFLNLKNNKNKIIARCLVYSYSKIISSDPCLDIEYQPNNYLGNEAKKLYNKIRTYCY